MKIYFYILVISSIFSPCCERKIGSVPPEFSVVIKKDRAEMMSNISEYLKLCETEGKKLSSKRFVFVVKNNLLKVSEGDEITIIIATEDSSLRTDLLTLAQDIRDKKFPNLKLNYDFMILNNKNA